MDKSLEAKILEKRYGTIIALKGQLSISTHKKLKFLIQELLTEDVLHFALDLSELESIDAKGMSVLTQLLDSLGHKGIELYAFGMNEDTYDILSCVDLDGDIQLLETKAEFLSLMNKIYN